MKKWFAITLLSIHLFNLGGYALLFHFFMYRADRQLEQQLNHHSYADNDLLQVKVPLHMPYINSSDYERVDGSISINGIYYNYVKRRVYNDTLYLLCVPNTCKTQLSTARAVYAQKATDAPGAEKSRGGLKKGMAGWEYRQPILQYHVATMHALLTSKTDYITCRYSTPFIPTDFPPPQEIV